MTQIARRFAIACALTTCVISSAAAQSVMRETRPPAITAEAEPWYLSGLPVTFAGQIYYPAGARLHFIPSEMVRSGDFEGIPLYSRTTIEPYSKVFVPVGGGLVQPYERRRDGDLAGTVGSSAPSFPVALATDSAFDDRQTIPQAPAPPTLSQPALTDSTTTVPRPVGTAGTLATAPRDVSTVAPRRASPPFRRRADTSNAIFMTFQGERWFSSGSAVEFDPSRFVAVGDREGFPVYSDRAAPRLTIYVPVVAGTPGLVAPYSKHSD